MSPTCEIRPYWADLEGAVRWCSRARAGDGCGPEFGYGDGVPRGVLRQKTLARERIGVVHAERADRAGPGMRARISRTAAPDWGLTRLLMFRRTIGSHA
jgi:hypothetical protein